MNRVLINKDTLLSSNIIYENIKSLANNLWACKIGIIYMFNWIYHLTIHFVYYKIINLKPMTVEKILQIPFFSDIFF